ncbi:MAG: Ig-like domain-containing protein, partial [Chitinophagaceae bacterium]
MKKFFFLLGAGLLLLCSAGSSQTIPAGFTTSVIGADWNLPLGTAFTADGQKLFVWEKDGRVYVCNRDASGNYVKQTTPVLDISEEVANWGDHGLMGLALDPNYLSNGLIYLLYVVDRHYLINFGTPNYNPATSTRGGTIGRITRYKTVTNGNSLITDLSSRMILLGETKSTGIALTHDSHGLGTLAFAADGTLLATCGDGGSYYAVDKGSDPDTDFDLDLIDGILRPEENVGAFRAQMLNCHNGKLLRIDPVTGNGVSSNPYYDPSAPRSPKSRVWAFGLRNPFRMSVKPGTGSTNPAAGDIGEVYIGDVGWNTYEEVNVITTPGVNCGWPLFEGLTPTPGYTQAITANQDEPNPLYGINGCNQQFLNFQDLVKQATADNDKTVYNPCNPLVSIGTGNRFVHHRPVIDWQHFVDTARIGTFSGNNAATALVGTPESGVIGSPFPGNCSIGGPWYSGTSFPAEYNNRYFVADHDGKWIKCFSVDYTSVVTEVKTFGTGFLGTVCLTVNPLDGSLVVVELGNFTSILPSIKQIKFGGNQSPVVKITSDKIFGPSALAVNFNGSNSSDADGTVTGYAWNFGDGGTSTVANPSHSFTAPANTPTKFVVKLTVTDNLGAFSTDSITISVNNTPPVVNITSPVKNSLYKIGPDTVYTCRATVTDAEPGPLKYEWQTFLRHNSHVHPQVISTDTVTTTNIERIGCNGDTYYWLIKLTVTDAAGLSTVDSSKIFPDCNVGPDITPPTVSSALPVNGATGVNATTSVTAIFNEAINASTVTSTTFQLKNASNIIVPATINILSNQITIIPSAVLAGSTVYTATIKGGASGVKDVAGNALVNDYAWSFTTGVVDNTPPVITSVTPLNGATGVGTGTSVIANFSEAINPSTITATTVQLKNAANTLIAAVLNIAGNQVTLTPSAILTGSTVYTVTLKSGTSGIKDLAGNALLSDYSWSFTTGAADNTAPVVSSVLPLNGATSVNTNTTIAVNLSEAINPATVNASTFLLKDAGNIIVPATISTSGNQLTLSPSAILAGSAVYTVTIKSGASGIKDLAGNALAADYNWTFTTAASSGGTFSTIFLETDEPTDPLNNDGEAIEVGMKFRASQNGFITGIRYYKGLNATGTRSGHLWSSTGTLLATATFTGETASGWQQVLFNSPVAITANTTYVVSYFSSTGYYASSSNYFTQPVIKGSLKALANGEDGPDGLYQYSATAVFPSNSANGANYWVDVMFNSSAGNLSPAVTTHPASQTKCAGSSASFTTAATGTPAPTLQWQASTNGTSWTNINGATNSVLTFVTAISDNNKQYRAVWTNSGGFSNTNPATLTVNSVPQLSGGLSAIVTSGAAFTYTAASTTAGTTFAWSRAAVTGISNAAASGAGSINETLVNTTSSPVNVVYAFTLNANVCTNTQNVVVAVNPASTAACVITSSVSASNFSGTAIPAGRYIWFNSSFDPGPLPAGTDPVTVTINNGVISFTANNVPYTLSVPNAHIRFDATATSASTQFINNVWETVVPRAYTSDIFMSGLSYLVPVNFPGNYMNVKWTADISLDKPGISLGWRWGAAVYTSFAGNAGVNVKPINGSTQNPYANTDRAGTPENYKSFVVDGAKGTGGTNYTGSFTIVNTATCTGGGNTIPPSPT